MYRNINLISMINSELSLYFIEKDKHKQRQWTKQKEIFYFNSKIKINIWVLL